MTTIQERLRMSAGVPIPETDKGMTLARVQTAMRAHNFLHREAAAEVDRLQAALAEANESNATQDRDIADLTQANTRLLERAEAAHARTLQFAARIARDGCLVPPDGGSPTDAERELCEHIATLIEAHVPAESKPDAYLDKVISDIADFDHPNGDVHP